MQVKDLQMSLDAAQRAIDAKQQQMKPLEAEVRECNRQCVTFTSECLCVFLFCRKQALFIDFLSLRISVLGML